MESKLVLANNGQQLTIEDVNLLGEVSGLADDRVLAELFRMTPYNGSTVSRGIIPYGHATSGITALVTSNGATGTVAVFPFRAIIGSRTAVGTDPKKNWRDIRSAIAVGTAALHQPMTITPNASGNPRWDLVYAAVAVDANSSSVTRKVKNPTTKVIAGATVVTSLVTNVTVGVQAGTPAASPAWPTIAADSGSTYYIPLAYVRVPNGFGAGSTVTAGQIALAAPTINLDDTTGGMSLRVASSQYTPNATKIAAWVDVNSRPSTWMPPTLVGGTSLLVALDLQDPSSANWSHVDGDVIDSSTDWRGRLVRWMATVHDTDAFRWETSSGVEFPGTNSRITHDVTTSKIISGFGYTLQPSSDDGAMHLLGNTVAGMADTAQVGIYADNATGALKVTIVNSPGVKIFVWLDFTGPYHNSY